MVQAYQEALGEHVSEQPATTAASTPAPGTSSGPKLKLNLSGVKEARASVQAATRPSKEKVIRLKRPSLPEKTVSKDIVASLPQYDESEKATWAATLSSKQTEELLHLLKKQDDIGRPSNIARPVTTTFDEVTPQRISSSGPRDIPHNRPVEQSNLSAQGAPAASIPLPQQTLNGPGAGSPLGATSVQATGKIPASISDIPSPSASASMPPASEPPPAQKQVQAHVASSNVPLAPRTTHVQATAPPTVGSSRTALANLYASISVPAAIPRPAMHWAQPFRPKQPAAHLPLIRYFDFIYDLGVPGANKPSEQTSTEWQNRIKLKNMRGITSHIVAISRTTRNIEITAFLEEGYYELSPYQCNQRMEPIGHDTSASIHETLSYAPLPELSLECNGKAPKGELIHPGGDPAKRPIAHKWSFAVDPAIVNFVIEVHVRRRAEQPDGPQNPARQEVKETCMIFVNRQ